MMLVIDASVAVRGFAEEAGSDEARAFLQDKPDDILIAPALILLEFNGALWKRFAAGTVSRRQLDLAPDALCQLVVIRPLDQMLADAARKLALLAMELAERSGDARPFPASIYDCAYIALAVAEGAELITADKRQFALAVESGCPARLLGR